MAVHARHLRRRSVPASRPTRRSRAVDILSLSVYQEFPFAVAPVFELLRWCEDDRGASSSTRRPPGPVGMVAALLARSLGVPLVATYHTDVPRLGFFLTGDRLLEEMLWSYVRWFYGQCAVVFCPSRAVQDDLGQHGVPSRFELVRPGRRRDGISPRSAATRRSTGGSVAARRSCCGSAASRRRRARRRWPPCTTSCSRAATTCSLVIVGDGPYREEFQRMAPQASFLGVQDRPTSWLEIYASADVFVFPGLAETFGQVLLEAAASGLPAVVTRGRRRRRERRARRDGARGAPGDVRGIRRRRGDACSTSRSCGDDGGGGPAARAPTQLADDLRPRPPGLRLAAPVSARRRVPARPPPARAPRRRGLLRRPSLGRPAGRRARFGCCGRRRAAWRRPAGARPRAAPSPAFSACRPARREPRLAGPGRARPSRRRSLAAARTLLERRGPPFTCRPTKAGIPTTTR